MDDKKLLGDKVEEVLEKVGADKVATVIERATKRPCNCKKRKEFLNKIHKQMIQMQQQVLKAQQKNGNR